MKYTVVRPCVDPHTYPVPLPFPLPLSSSQRFIETVHFPQMEKFEFKTFRKVFMYE